MNDFELPSNIKQIGGVDEYLKIYVEDYAITYLKRFAESGGGKERIAFLVGKHMVIDAQNYLFVCGAIQGKFTEFDEGIEIFSEESHDYAYEQLERFFEGYDIVGWMQSQPGYGIGLNPVSADYHMNNFIKPYNVMFVCDPSERLDTFYSWDRSMSGIGEREGYFIYYDKNRGMQEYMLENRITGPKTRTATSSKSRPESGGRAAAAASRSGARERKAAERPVAVARSERREGGEYKKVVNMLVSLSAVLFVICFIMGAGLIQSDGRISQLEKDLTTLNGNYDYLFAQISQISEQAVYTSGGKDKQIDSQNDNADYTSAAATPTPAPAPNPTPTMIPIPMTTLTPGASTAAPPSPTENAGAGATAGNNTPSPTEPPTVNFTNQPESTVKPAEPEETDGSANQYIDFDTYVVKQGDTLSQIVINYYGSSDYMQLVMDFNNILDPDTIYFGKVLKMPRQ